MKYRLFLFQVTGILLVFSCKNDSSTNDYNQALWYKYPAKYWNSQALHLGNGYFGVSFFGGIQEEKFALSEASMWTGQPANGNWEKAGVNPKALAYLPEIRKDIVGGQTHLADSLITEDFFGSSEYYGHFTSVGTLYLDLLNQDSSARGYIRKLDLQNSLGSVQYEQNNSSYKREYFCSYPDRIMGMKLISGKPGRLSVNMYVDIMQDSSEIEISGQIYRVRGYINGNLRPFEILIHVKNYGGDLGSENKELTVRKADSIEIFLTMATNYKMDYPAYTGEDPEIITNRIMQHALEQNYEGLRKKHIQDYRSLYDRVHFKLAGNDEAECLPTNERFQRLRKGLSDPGYKVLTFNLGRYMIISSSRPNTLPANLQGVWNAFKIAPWAGNYQSNINIQEIYWSCGPTNLPECQQAYIDWIDNLSISGKEIAKRVYGTDGWVSHTTGNIWGHAAPIGGHPWGMYPVGAAWHCQHVWDQYAFTQDPDYLKNQAYPLLKDASIFWLENLIPFQGYLISAPTVSAEHGALLTENGLNPAFHDFRSDKYMYSLPGVYQDVEMIWDLFTNTAKAAKIVGENEFADSLMRERERLLPLKIGKYGQLQEWYEDIDNPDCHHRHIAHLYAVCPGTEIYPTTTPDLAEAAKKSLKMRGDGRFLEQELASGGNWARADRMWCWTRLLDGNRADKIMTEMLTEEGFENGLTFQHAQYSWERKDFYMEDGLYLHYQLDGSASLPGCIAEMLVQSHMGEIHLLPALPDEFNAGEISGIKARGGFTVDLSWNNGELTTATITCPKGKDLPPVRLKGKIIQVDEFDNIQISNQ